VDKSKSSVVGRTEHPETRAGDPFVAASLGYRRRTDDTIEAHYASLERPCYCYGSGVVVLTVEEDGQEHDDVVPCRRCNRHHERR
jgi:hypothetical protein